ncbi:MAG: sensor histidine kinase [Mucilaginibacter sp.]
MKKFNIVSSWHALIGNNSNFNLEERIFHAVCIYVLAGLFISIPLDYFTGLPLLAVLMLVVFIIASVIYYFSRFRAKFSSSIIAFQIANNLFLIANYFYNSGIQGTTYAVFLLSFFICVTIMPKRQYKLWLPINIGLILALLAFENFHPQWIDYNADRPANQYFEFGYTYLIIAGVILSVISSMKNAYDREKEAVHQKAEALEISNSTKNKLLSILAHDLKEPLSSIQGFLELLVEYKLDQSEKESIEKELLRRTKETSYMLANVLSWTKKQMDAVTVILLPLKLSQVLRTTLELLKGIAKEKGIDLQYHIDDDICVIGDKDMLQLVVRNLVMNAIKFTYAGGSVSIDADKQPDKCVITVRDTGAGIPRERQASLFTLDAKSTYGTGKEKGIGLGLILCREFIELQGGHIEFTSKPGSGSAFSISLYLCHLTARSPDVQETFDAVPVVV